MMFPRYGDPFVAGIEYFAQIVVGDDLIGQGAAASDVIVIKIPQNDYSVVDKNKGTC